MKKMSVKREVLIIMMIVVSLIVISTRVLATNGPVQIPVDGQEETGGTDGQETPNPTPDTTPTPTTPNETADANQNNGNLPQTGDASDYAIFMLIVVAIVVAVYAYKKVRDYNNI